MTYNVEQTVKQEMQILEAIDQLSDQPEKWGNRLSAELICSEIREKGLSPVYSRIRARLIVLKEANWIDSDYFLTDRGKEKLAKYKQLIKEIINLI